MEIKIKQKYLKYRLRESGGYNKTPLMDSRHHLNQIVNSQVKNIKDFQDDLENLRNYNNKFVASLSCKNKNKSNSKSKGFILRRLVDNNKYDFLFHPITNDSVLDFKPIFMNTHIRTNLLKKNPFTPDDILKSDYQKQVGTQTMVGKCIDDKLDILSKNLNLNKSKHNPYNNLFLTGTSFPMNKSYNVHNPKNDFNDYSQLINNQTNLPNKQNWNGTPKYKSNVRYLSHNLKFLLEKCKIHVRDMHKKSYFGTSKNSLQL